jgi:2-polyprenyl-3-methyl-5-hydroxy-6-metoxy-1,4-benzoquinol methylase
MHDPRPVLTASTGVGRKKLVAMATLPPLPTYGDDERRADPQLKGTAVPSTLSSVPTLADLETHPSVKQLVQAQLRVWPEHERFLATRFASADMSLAEEVAGLIGCLSESLPRLADDYRWLCERLYEEELHFRRTGAYRLSTFDEAVRDVYSNDEFMKRYMNALLLSQLWWENHTRVIEYYCRHFLPSSRPHYSHLEIGPGHGLLLYFAARDRLCRSVTAWDLSDASLAATRVCLQRLNITREVRLVKRNLFDALGAEEPFDSIVLSEVCEHLEDPRSALVRIRQHLAPGGRLFVNVPVNSPAPDHIYLLRTPEEATALVASAGYRIEDSKSFPMTGHTEARARKSNTTISCVILGTVE